MSSLALQSQFNFILALITSGFSLGGITGILIGAIAWSASEKGGRGVMNMMIGAVLGLIIGFVVVGTGIIDQFTSFEAILEGGGLSSPNTFGAILRIIFFTLVGMAVGSAVSSFGRALFGGLIGIAAGTISGVLLILINIQAGISIVGPAASMIVAVITLLLVGIMSVGQTS